ncbi:MAG: 50S ribosomal protein L23 [Candidatus Pacebacteria bacterium]|nr:50S ribosomal protein L23 [Candidatus Paceibacterota bacterium]
MGILGTKKDSKKTEKSSQEDFSWVIVNPRVTEKAAMISSDNVFTFDVATAANKIQIKKAITEKYGVTPISVNVVNQKARKEMRRGRKVHKKGTKKAMVTLKKGDTIELA